MLGNDAKIAEVQQIYWSFSALNISMGNLCGWLRGRLVSMTILCMVQCKFCEYDVFLRLNVYLTAPDSRLLLRCT